MPMVPTPRPRPHSAINHRFVQSHARHRRMGPGVHGGTRHRTRRPKMKNDYTLQALVRAELASREEEQRVYFQMRDAVAAGEPFQPIADLEALAGVLQDDSCYVAHNVVTWKGRTAVRRTHLPGHGSRGGRLPARRNAGRRCAAAAHRAVLQGATRLRGVGRRGPARPLPRALIHALAVSCSATQRHCPCAWRSTANDSRQRIAPSSTPWPSR